MKVTVTSLHSPRMIEKNLMYHKIFGDKLNEFFHDRFYGTGVVSIRYREFIVPSDISDSTIKTQVYSDEKKEIDCIIEPNYKKAASISLNKYGSFLANYYIIKTEEFKNLLIDDFDISLYLEDLRNFFRENKLLE